MLKGLVDFINFMFIVIALPLGMFGICVGIYAIVQDVKEIKEMDKEKICLKK
ncbi:hypothetical protein QCI77_30715 [Bacillus cereus group sp. MG9]|uniref:hypothetical protein n=1 Tax=Bacillus cereus group sp. MG9 TaxID=3040247 RepID=UPI003391F978